VLVGSVRKGKRVGGCFGIKRDLVGSRKAGCFMFRLGASVDHAMMLEVGWTSRVGDESDFEWETGTLEGNLVPEAYRV